MPQPKTTYDTNVEIDLLPLGEGGEAAACIRYA